MRSLVCWRKFARRRANSTPESNAGVAGSVESGGTSDGDSARPRPLREGDPLLGDAIFGDLIAHGAAPVLDDGDEAADAVADALASHHQDRVGHGADVAGRHF